MSELVSVVDHLYERQGVKLVLRNDEMLELPPGHLPEPGDELLARYGESNFQIELEHPVHSVDALPASVMAALDRIAERIYAITDEGVEDPAGPSFVEAVLGPFVRNGAIVLYTDTDDLGLGRTKTQTVVGILVDEIGSLGSKATISVANPPPAG